MEQSPLLELCSSWGETDRLGAGGDVLRVDPSVSRGPSGGLVKVGLQPIPDLLTETVGVGAPNVHL